MVLLWIFLMAYLLLVVSLTVGFYLLKTPVFNNLQPTTSFSIVVPFRNEAINLPKLLDTISRLDYPKHLFEVVLVDDASTDGFNLPNYPFQVKKIDSIRQTSSPKKDAITTAISVAKHQWIVSTDADCLVPPNWLFLLDNCIQTTNALLVAAPVKFSAAKGFLANFQLLDFASLQGLTIGSFGLKNGVICNGANLAYKKSFFLHLNGFEGNDTIASGDDVFLLQKATKVAKKRVVYLKSQQCIVQTSPETTWKKLFQQRLRWAAKTTSYTNPLAKAIGFVVVFANVAFVLICTSQFFYPNKVAFILLVVKLILDAFLLLICSKFLQQKVNYHLFLASFFYPIWVIVVAFFSVFGTYHWKGRQFKS